MIRCIFLHKWLFFFFFLLYEPPWPEAPGESLFNKPHKKFARNFCVLPGSSHPLTHIPFKPAGGSQREPKPLSPDRQRGDSRKACRCSGESGRQAHPAFRRPRALTRRHVSLFSGEQTWKPAMMWHCSVCSGSGIGKARKELPSCPSAPGVSENPHPGLLHIKGASPGLFSLLMVLIFCGVRTSSPNFQVVAQECGASMPLRLEPGVWLRWSPTPNLPSGKS